MSSMLSDVKRYLHIGWDDESTDMNIEGYIARGMSRLNDIAGKSLDFITEGLPRQLLLDYCRYANSQALEMFAANFQDELLTLSVSGSIAGGEEANDED